MYELYSRISSFFSGPFLNLAYSLENLPVLFAFFLGLVGAVAPCQFTGNIGAITIYSNQSLNRRIPWGNVLVFALGKIVVFSTMGLMIWMLGSEIQKSFTVFFPYLRKMIGPILIAAGLYMIGLFKMHWTFKLGEIPSRFFTEKKWGSFLMGISFTLAFCPTMFVLFFMTLMPVSLTSSYGQILPVVFGLGTSVPVFFVMFLIWYFGMSGSFMKKGRRTGLLVQRLAGVIMIVIGFFDTITYWS